jgi:hypothetical protein
MIELNIILKKFVVARIFLLHISVYDISVYTYIYKDIALQHELFITFYQFFLSSASSYLIFAKI